MPGSKTCVWVLIPGGKPNGPKWCGEKTKYRMVPDGGEPGALLVRQYDNFCPKHRAIIDSTPEVYDDDLE